MQFGEKTGVQKPPFPLAAMIDILFLLLLFFMLTGLYAEMEAELNITLPTSEQAGEVERERSEIIINVMADGTYVVNQISHTAAGLDTILAQLAAAPYRGEHIIIRGDKEAKYDYIVTLLDLCRKHDIWNVSFAVRKTEPTAAAVP
jgi:biopolymer transport protein ExbD